MVIHIGALVDARNASADEARDLAEGARESWKGRAFLRELFLGTLRVDYINPWPVTPARPEFLAFMDRLERFLLDDVDSSRIDTEGQYGERVLDGLRRLGAFALKIPTRYGGHGLSHAEYCKAVELIGRYDGSLVALVSAHNSIGVPMPVTLFGTDDQKERFLPLFAKGAISAFALTEPDVGSDPARLATTARRTADGDWILQGEKLWITNGTIADWLIVMARDAETNQIHAFIVSGQAPGMSVKMRCRFMGLRALENGWLGLDGVRVSEADRLGKPGEGLKIALVTLNTGRLSLPAACLGGARRALEACRTYAARRVQWGAAVGQHEAVAHKLGDMAATVWAMESWCHLATELAAREGYDIRLEAATAKEWGSTRGWTVIDEAIQIHGGRGYETEESLVARGDFVTTPLERMMRDSRINRIFEGSSEIMHLFMARELVDKHLAVAGPLLAKGASWGQKLAALPGIARFYAGWYPRLWMGWTAAFRYGDFGDLAPHLRWADAASRRLARTVFHLMVRHQAGLERRQGLLFRTVDIAMEIAVLVASVVHATDKARRGDPSANGARELTHVFAANARALVDERFRALADNADELRASVGRSSLAGRHDWQGHRSAAANDERAAAK